jgi:hypothetical protein
MVDHGPLDLRVHLGGDLRRDPSGSLVLGLPGLHQPGQQRQGELGGAPVGGLPRLERVMGGTVQAHQPRPAPAGDAITPRRRVTTVWRAVDSGGDLGRHDRVRRLV